MRMYGFLFVACLCIPAWSSIDAQTVAPEAADGIATDPDVMIADWVANLYTFGVSADSDTLLIASEVRTILENEDLRAYLYPMDYTWETALQLMKEMQLKRAFWFFINLYQQEEQQELVMRMVISYDSLFEMDAALLSSFYTYGMLDPEVSEILEDETVRIMRPDLVEAKLRTVREMVKYIQSYRIYVSGE